MTTLYVQEYIQVAHRLMMLPGKCQQIHGHSMHIKVTVCGVQNKFGYLADARGYVVDFSELKQVFRAYINSEMDHHLMLNEEDPLRSLNLPGATYWPGDPCVENIAKWTFDWLLDKTGYSIANVEVAETATNGVIYP